MTGEQPIVNNLTNSPEEEFVKRIKSKPGLEEKAKELIEELKKVDEENKDKIDLEYLINLLRAYTLLNNMDESQRENANDLLNQKIALMTPFYNSFLKYCQNDEFMEFLNRNNDLDIGPELKLEEILSSFFGARNILSSIKV